MSNDKLTILIYSSSSESESAGTLKDRNFGCGGNHKCRKWPTDVNMHRITN